MVAADRALVVAVNRIKSEDGYTRERWFDSDGMQCVRIIDPAPLAPGEIEVDTSDLVDVDLPERWAMSTADRVLLEELGRDCGGGVTERGVTGAPSTGAEEMKR